MLNRYAELANAPKRFETAEVTEYAKQEAHHPRRIINAVTSVPTNISPHATRQTDS